MTELQSVNGYKDFIVDLSKELKLKSPPLGSGIIFFINRNKLVYKRKCGGNKWSASSPEDYCDLLILVFTVFSDGFYHLDQTSMTGITVGVSIALMCIIICAFIIVCRGKHRYSLLVVCHPRCSQFHVTCLFLVGNNQPSKCTEKEGIHPSLLQDAAAHGAWLRTLT